MVFGTVLYGLVAPIIIALFWSFFRLRKNFNGFGKAFVPAGGLLIGYFGLVGTPGVIMSNALNGLFYGTVLLLLYSFFEHLQPETKNFWAERFLLLTILFVLVFYPRFQVIEHPLREALQGLSLVGIGLVILVLQTFLQSSRSFQSAFFGIYYVATGIFLGIYTSFLVGQLILAVGTGILSLVGLSFVFKTQGPDRVPQAFQAGFLLLMLLYVLFFTTLKPATVGLFALGSLLYVIPLLPRLRKWSILSRILTVFILGLVFIAGAGIEESYLVSGEESSSYRPYR